MTAGKRSDRLALHVVGALLLAAACRAPATPAAPVATAPPTAPITSPSVLPDVPAAAAPRVVRHADVPSIALAPVYVAAERGYFAAEGLDVQVERVAGAGDAVALLGTGQFDMSAGGLSAGTFNAIQRGVDIRMVAPTSFLPLHGGATPLLIRKDLAGQVRTVPEMRGHKVALNVRGAANEYLLYRVLNPAGLELADVEIVLLPFPDVPQALAQGAVDFALPAEPFATRAIQAGGAAVFVEDIAPGFMNTLLYYGDRFRREQPEAAQAVVVALMRAARDLQGDAAKSDAHLAIIAKYTGISPEVLRASAFNAWDPDLTIRGDDIMDQQLVHIRHGRTEYSEPIPLERLVDERYQRAALQRLGPAKR